MSDFVKQCVLRRIKWSASVIFVIVLFIALFMGAGTAASKASAGEVLLVVMAALLGGVIGFCISLTQPRRFVKMIRRQEEVLGVIFGEEEFTPTPPKASRLNQHYHFSDNWYMCEGSWALHRLYIVKVTQKVVSGARAGLQYHALVETVDGKTWKLQMESASDLKRFYTWYKDAGK
ncbi:MAG: hypothetical protein IKL25_09390 [Clostridia bacterium]|nr:hypothetical protein [Clostridia bacterium]